MTLKATANDPADAKRLFDEYAAILDIYASDQLASLRWPGDKKGREIRAQLYKSIAEEIRSIVFEKGNENEQT